MIDAAADAIAQINDEPSPSSLAEPVVDTPPDPAPSVAAAAERVPPATRALLAELFKAEIATVKRISRDQLI